MEELCIWLRLRIEIFALDESTIFGGEDVCVCCRVREELTSWMAGSYGVDVGSQTCWAVEDAWTMACVDTCGLPL